MTLILNGKELAAKSEKDFANRVSKIKDKSGITPILATILVGDDPASETYVKMKGNACERIGMRSLKVELSNETTTEELINKNSIGSLLFSAFKGVEDFLRRIIKITSILKVQLLKQHEQDFQIETCNQFLSVFNSLLNRFHQFNFMNSLTDIKIIFELLVEQESFNIKGDVLGEGVQIMGLLESCLLYTSPSPRD